MQPGLFEQHEPDAFPPSQWIYWLPAKDGNGLGFSIYRRHYSAKNRKPKIRQFVGPGEKLVLMGRDYKSVFAWRKFIDDSGQQGVCCAVFRNEGRNRSSEMILEAMRIGWQRWPGERYYTLVDAGKVKSRNPGYCFKCSGWTACGTTKNGLLVLESLPHGRS